MAFVPKNPGPQYDRLLVSLNNSGIQRDNNALYQVVRGLIDSAQKFQALVKGDLEAIIEAIKIQNGELIIQIINLQPFYSAELWALCYDPTGLAGKLVFSLNPEFENDIIVGNDINLTRFLSWGPTSSFPLLKRDNANLQVRLGDDSDFTNLELRNELQSGYLQQAVITVPSTPSSGFKRYFSQDIGGKNFLSALGSDGRELVLARDNVIVVRNTTGGTLTKGQAVYFNGGSSGNFPHIALARADAEATMPAIGLLFEDIANNGFGRVMVWGRLSFDTSTFTAGDLLYVSNSVAGGLTNVAPTSPNLNQRIAVVAVSGVGNGAAVITQTTVKSASSGSTQSKVITLSIDGGGNVITTGIKQDIQFNFNGTIQSWTILADQAGDIVIDIWKDTYANYPPTVADTITASAKPELSGVDKNTDSTLTGWTTTISAGDTLRFNVDSVSDVTRITLQLVVQLS